MRNTRDIADEYVFRPGDLLGTDGKPSTIKCLKVAVKLLEDEHLNNVEKARPALEALCRCMHFEDIKEAIAFIPVFDRYCAGCHTDLDDASRFYDCSMMDIMEFIPGFNALEERGVLNLDNPGERRPVKKQYKVDGEIVSAVIEGRPFPKPQKKEKAKLDQFQFCKEVDTIKEERSSEDISSEAMFREIEQLEEKNNHLTLVQEMRSRFQSIKTRSLFYEMCNDFVNSNGDGETDIASTLKDMYDMVRERMTQQSLLTCGKHELLTSSLIIKSCDSGLKLSDAGIELFLGDNADIYVKTTSGLDCFEFCKAWGRVKKEREMGHISTDVMFHHLESLERKNASLSLVKELTAKTDDIQARAWFYEMCNDFQDPENRSRLTSISCTLQEMYSSVKDMTPVRNLFRDGKHPLQQLRLAEQVAGTHLSLTEEGLILFMGEENAKAFIKPYWGLDRFAFAKMMYGLQDDDIYESEKEHIAEKMEKIERANPVLAFIDKLKEKFAPCERLIFYWICDNCIDDQRFHLDNLTCIYKRSECGKIASLFKNDEHPLQKEGLVRHEKAGFFQESILSLTDKGKELFFEEDAKYYIEKSAGKNFIPTDKITSKRLFFSTDLQRQLDLLKNSLREDNLKELRSQLEKRGLPQGICTLLYGLPGTGKTESVMQIAKETGRPVLHVDISETKSCWFGESEKLIKEVFTKYRDLCKTSEIRPILLFNEADAIFSKRKEVTSGNVAQTENAIQNIILEEMERLDGILIATTNLTENLDAAFERRFLFKIRYDKPTAEAKRSIWMDKMPSLTEDKADILAGTFDFSGGEIDNIVRKAAMSEIIEGRPADFSSIMTLCNEEKINNKGTRKIGF